MKPNLKTVSQLLESPVFADGAITLYGSTREAAKRLGISESRLRASRSGKSPPDKTILDVQKALGKLPSDDVKTLQAFTSVGDKLSPKQIEVIKRKSKADPSYRKVFRRESKRQAKRYKVDYANLAGSPKSKKPK
jgi:hypothetical protein